MWNLIFLVTGLFFITLLILIFFSKQVINSKENNLFRTMVIINFIGYLLEITLQICVRVFTIDSILVDIFGKIYLVYVFVLVTIFNLYVFVICNAKKSYYFYTVMSLILIIIYIITIYSLPMYKYNDGVKMYTYGPAVDTLIFAHIIFVGMWIVLLIKNYRILKSKKFLPIFVMMGMIFLTAVLQMIDQSVLITTMVGTFVCYTMYHTIENPDVKMLEEFRIAKDRAEKANEEKEMFLYNITQDIRNPLSEIKKASNWLDENIKNQDVLDASYYINKNASNVLDIVNDVLDISSMELTNIKVYDSKYDINNLVKYIEKTYKPQVDEKVEFRLNIDTNIPSSLYGDQLRLKQILQILLENAIKYTNSGFIEFRLNTIVKKDICRLIITVEDSGEGIKPSEMDAILNKDERLIINEKIDDNKKNIAMAKSITNLLGGILLIDTEIGSGTKITIVLDQKIYDEKSIELNKIEKDVNKFIDNPKVLVVIEDSEYREKVLKKLSRYELDITSVELGSRCLEKIRSNKKYDLIIMDEELRHLSVLEVMDKLKNIPSFNIPVAVLTNNIENKGYINDGFKYLLDRKIVTKEIDKVIEKIDKSANI